LTGPRKPGRPRSAEADKAILSTTLELLASEGLQGLSIERVAAGAGVGKTTIYRRWSRKRDLAQAALEFFAVEIKPPELPDTGSVREDLLEFARLRNAVLPRTRLNRLMPRLATESADDVELHRLVRKIVIDPERAAIREIFRRGLERGELRADGDIELADDLFAGPFVYRLLISRSRAHAVRDLPGPLIDLLFRGAGA